MPEPIQLGDHVRCTITGMAGVAVCRAEWLNGCVRVGIQSRKLTPEGKIPEPEHVDEAQLTVIKRAKAKARKPAGGPKPDAQRHSDAR